MIVMKFGGTSTQDAAAISNVVRIVREHLTQKPVVVISAIAQATNFLEQAGKLAAEGKGPEARAKLGQLFDRHYAILDTLVRDKNRHTALRTTISGSLSELEELVKGISILRELTPRTLDSLFCYGELLSSRLVCAALQEAGTDAEWVDTKDFMVTDEDFNRAMPMMEVVTERLKAVALPILARGGVPVTQGFIGVTANGRRTTMGRESSDYSASIIGTALQASDIQIWTDVDGVLTADPRVVDHPKKIKLLSFEEAFELSYFGAKVLHPNTMLPAMEKNIPIHIYNSKNYPQSGTRVERKIDGQATMVKSVAYKGDMAFAVVTPHKRYSQYIFWEHVQNLLTKLGIVASMSVTSEYNYAFVFEEKQYSVALEHELSSIGNVSVTKREGIICIVGSNIRHSKGILNRLFQVLSPFGIDLVSFGATESSISLLMDKANIPDAVRKIHQEFFEGTTHPEIFEALTQLKPVPIPAA